ncbi:MAG: hypothetical protein M1836_004991 [Candelina mexicana]|nr:MAG: hypothetical protein M1836_004991 [Candelina mexicana]
MASKTKLSVPSSAALPHSHTFPSSNASVIKALTKLSRPSLLSLAIEWIRSADQKSCAPFLAAGNAEEEVESMYSAAQSLDELRETYEEYQSRKGGKKEIVDRIVEGDWRHGITLYQLAMADMRNLLDHPTAHRWSALKLAHIKATPLQDNANSRNTATNVSEAVCLPRFHAPTFLRNLQREIAPIVKAHYYLTRADNLPLTFLRVQVYDSPYSTQRTLQERGTNASSSSAETSKTIWVAFPDGTPAVYVSLATVVGQGAAGEGRSLRKVVLDALPKAFSKPHERYTLQTTSLSARSLPALLSLRGPGRSNAAAGGWSIFADGTVEGNPLDFALSKAGTVLPSGSLADDKENRVNFGAHNDSNKRKSGMMYGLEVDEAIDKRRKLVAAGRFGTSALEGDGKGMDRLDIRINDPFTASSNGVARPANDVDAPDGDDDAVTRRRKSKQTYNATTDDFDSDDDNSSSSEGWRPNIQFTFHGSHVFAGIRKLVEEGVVDGEKMPGWMTGEAGDNIPDPDHYLSKWFLDAPLHEIRRDNVKEFYRWALLNSGTYNPADEEELDEYLNGLEKTMGHRICSGRGSAKCLRLTLDEVKPRHRPLVWYLTVFAVDNYTHVSMLYHRFEYHRTRITPYPTIFPFRPQTLLTRHRSPVRTLSYWHRPHKSTTKLPILFLHGIGIGLMPYVPFLGAVNGGPRSDDGEVGIIAVEVLPVSFRMTHGLLGKAEMCHQLQVILLRHGFEKFVLVSHSYGSVITTHLLKSLEMRHLIASVVMVDPVSILLHLPDVAYNFTYRRPRRANEWQLWYFASTDIGVAHTLARCFFWSENILWKEDLGDRKCSVFLSGRDLIVNTEQVGQYLTGQHSSGEEDLDWKADPDGWIGEDGLKVVWCGDLDHAQIFDSKYWMPRLVDEVLDHSEQK